MEKGTQNQCVPIVEEILHSWSCGCSSLEEPSAKMLLGTLALITVPFMGESNINCNGERALLALHIGERLTWSLLAPGWNMVVIHNLVYQMVLYSE